MRALLFALAGALVVTGAATADHLDPQERVRAADQKAAAAMLLRKADLPRGYEPERTSDLEPHLTCRALDESDLVLTGRGKSDYWAREYQIVGSTSAVYRTARDSGAAWRRSTSTVGRRCVRDEYRKTFARQGETMRIAVQELALPKLAVTAKAYRLAISGADPARPPLLFVDVVLLNHGRAHVGLLFAGVVTPPVRATEIALSRLVAQRVRVALRGAS
jgi:hypothetical protein